MKSMGIYITLKRLNDGITDCEWEEVYKETLIALKNYPFADKVVVKTYGAKKYYQAERAKERDLKPLCEGKGWHTVGDLETCQYGESFVLVADNNYYKRKQDTQEGQDILKCITEDKQCVTVWDSKTQGEPYHVHLLAIACLIEDRLEGKVIVQGNIRMFEVEEACKWINKYVNKEVGYPVLADPHKLIIRLQKIHSKIEDQLKHFYDLYIDVLDGEVRGILEQAIGKDVLRKYYQEQLANIEVDTKEFVRLTEQMLKIGYTLEEVSAAFTHSKDRTRSEIETFIRYILTERISVYYLPKKEIYTPGNVEGQMVFMFDALMGYERNKYQLSEQERKELMDKLKLIFPQYMNAIEEITVEAIENKKEKVKRYEKYVETLNTALDQQRGQLEIYDIAADYELIDWEKGDTIAPDIEDQLRQIVELCKVSDDEEGDMNEVIRQLRDSDKFEYMLRDKSSKFLLPKSFWEYINENKDNDKVLKIIVNLLRIDVTSAKHYNLVKYILCNPRLIQDYILEEIE